MQKHSLIGASLGTMIEYYDYAIFALFLTVMMPVIMGKDTQAMSALLGGYVIMLVSQLLRPLGGVFFGRFGDTIGRKKALIYAIIGISLSTMLIGLMPGYQHIGIAAFILVMLLKSVQVFCFGGEYNGAGVYAVEHAPAARECFWGSTLTAMTLLGALAASCVGVVLTLGSLPSWSWRVAFVGGGLFGVLGIWYRRKMMESPEFLKAAPQTAISLKKLIAQDWRAILVAAAIGALSTAPFSTVVVFINPVLKDYGYFTTHQLMLLQTLVIFVAIVMLMLAGYLADKFSPKVIMMTGCLVIIGLSFPCLLSLAHHSLTWIILGQIILIIGNELVLGPSNAYMKRSFPVRSRYRGVSLGFCSGMALSGGLTPLVENAIYRLTGNFVWIGLWLAFISLCTLLALWKHTSAK